MRPGQLSGAEVMCWSGEKWAFKRATVRENQTKICRKKNYTLDSPCADLVLFMKEETLLMGTDEKIETGHYFTVQYITSIVNPERLPSEFQCGSYKCSYGGEATVNSRHQSTTRKPTTTLHEWELWRSPGGHMGGDQPERILPLQTHRDSHRDRHRDSHRDSHLA